MKRSIHVKFGASRGLVYTSTARRTGYIVCEQQTAALLRGHKAKTGDRFILWAQTEPPMAMEDWLGLWLRLEGCKDSAWWWWGSTQYLQGCSVFTIAYPVLNAAFRPVIRKLARQHKARKFKVWLKLEKVSA